MVFFKALPKRAFGVVLSLGLLASCIHKKYDTPITKNTQQPDKVLFDQAIKDIEHGRYEVARISLQTLMNTYESSEYMAKAKLAIADSWYREGGASGFAQAEAEYKDFILFYPNMEESAEAQNRVCEIHYKQMEKSDRDWTQTLRAETECRQLLVQFPNSKFAPEASQRLRNIQESLAEHEFVVGNFYWKRDMNPAAANRLLALVDQYPLYSNAGEALYEAGDAYSKMGPRFRKQSGEMFARIVRDYPLSNRGDDAKKRLQDLEMPVPRPDPSAVALEKYNLENYHHPSMVGRSTAWLHGGPDVTHAATKGAPTMTDPKATIPASVPVANNDAALGTGTSGGGTTDVTASTNVGPNSALDTKPDARSSMSAGQKTDATAQNQPLPTNRDKELQQLKAKQQKKQEKLAKKKKKAEGQVADNPDASTTSGTAPNVTVPPTTTSKQPTSQQPASTQPQQPPQQ